MINIRPLTQQHIRDQIASFSEVSGASDLTSLLKGRLLDRGCYVFPDRVSAGSNEVKNAVLQRVNPQLAVVTVVYNVKDARGEDAADVSFVYQEAVRSLLLGWRPHADFELYEYAGGNLVSFLNGFYIWKDSFKTQSIIQSTR